MFICGSRSFSHQEEDENGSNTSSCATSQKVRRSKSFSKITPKDGKKKNPFADRGLDKFSALLAELDKEKQQIFREIGSEDISFIRFVYEEDSQKVKPIIIRVGKQHIEKSNLSFLKHTPKSIEGTTSPSAADTSSKSPNKITEDVESKIVPQEITEDVESKIVPQEQKVEKRLQRWRESFRLEEWRESYYCFPAILVMILFFLAIYGRSFAILCTTIGLYFLPNLPGEGSYSRNMRKRKLSRKNIVYSGQGVSSQTSANMNGGADKFIAQRQHGHK